jgi:hypothetical protein
MLKKLLISASLLAAISPALAQSVQQAGSVSRNHIPVWNTNGVIADGGSSADSPISSIGVTNNGGSGFCVSSDRQSAAGRNQLCFGAATAGPATITLQNFGTAAPQVLNFVINGTVFPFPGSLASITIGSTPVIGGTNNNCLSITAGIVGQVNCAILASGTTGSGAIVLAGSPTLSGTIGGSLTSSGNQLWNGTATFGNNLLVNGTNSPASSSNQTVVMGTVSPPVLTNTGQAWLFNSAASGANLQGNGSNFDIMILNAAGSIIMQVATGTQNPTFPGVPVLSGLGSASCVNGLALDSSNRMITVSCPGAASSIQIGTTTVLSGTANDLLYNNAGVLGNTGITNFLTAGTGITISGTTNATVALTTPVSSANGGSGNSSPTAHTIPINEGSGSQNNTGTGSKGQAILSNGAADPSFQSGPWTLINTLTASNSTALQDTSSLTSAYAEYEIVIEDMISATNAVSCEIQVHSGGTFQSTTYVSGYLVGNGSTASSANSTTFIPCSAGATMSNTAPMIAIFRVNNPSAAVTLKPWTGFGESFACAVVCATTFGGYWNNSAAVDGFQIVMSSGNITSGKVKVYGRL